MNTKVYRLHFNIFSLIFLFFAFFSSLFLLNMYDAALVLLGCMLLHLFVSLLENYPLLIRWQHSDFKVPLELWVDAFGFRLSPFQRSFLKLYPGWEKVLHVDARIAEFFNILLLLIFFVTNHFALFATPLSQIVASFFMLNTAIYLGIRALRSQKRETPVNIASVTMLSFFILAFTFLVRNSTLVFGENSSLMWFLVLVSIVVTLMNMFTIIVSLNNETLIDTAIQKLANVPLKQILNTIVDPDEMLVKPVEDKSVENPFVVSLNTHVGDAIKHYLTSGAEWILLIDDAPGHSSPRTLGAIHAKSLMIILQLQAYLSI